MSFLLWIDEERDEAIDLGDPFTVWASFAEIGRVAGNAFPQLQAVPHQGEQVVPPAWLQTVRQQARECLQRHGSMLSAGTRTLLRSLMGSQAGEKSLAYAVKGEGSYFSSCERDEQGRCLPSGHSQGKKPEEAAHGKRPSAGKRPFKGPPRTVEEAQWIKDNQYKDRSISGADVVKASQILFESKRKQNSFEGRERLAVSVTPRKDLVARVVQAVRSLDAQGFNLVPLTEVRRALMDLSRPQQDEAIRQAVQEGLLSTSNLEGRHGISPEEREAALDNDGELVGFLSVRQGKSLPQVKKTPLRPGQGVAGDENEKVSIIADILAAVFSEEELLGIKQESKSLDDWAAKSGFTGRKKDKRGYNICYQDGRRVSCSKLSPSQGAGAATKPPGAESPHKRAPRGSKKVTAEDGKRSIAEAKGAGKLTAESMDKLLPILYSMTVVELRKLRKELGAQSAPRKAEMIERIWGHLEELDVPLAITGEEHGGEQQEATGEQQPERGEGSGEPAPEAGESGRGVGGEAEGPRAEEGGGGGADTGEPAGATAPEPEAEKPKLTPRQAASLETVNKKMDRYTKLFQAKGNHKAAEWMNLLHAHINSVGVEAALDALGPEVVGEEQPVEYVGHYVEADADGEFIRKYLARTGISLATSNLYDPSKRIISTVSPHTGTKPDSAGFVPRGKEGDIYPSDQTLRDKLHEAQNLPGLEKSKDLGDLVGDSFGGKVSHFTPDVLKKLDETYGEKSWIVKSYGAEAFAGYGIFFPQYISQVQQDARNAIWSSGEQLAKYGFEHMREKPSGGFGESLGKLDKVNTGMTLPTPQEEGKDRWEHPPEVQQAYNQKVLEAASQAGLLMDRASLGRVLSGPNVGGQEHEVYEDKTNGRFYKLTKGGHFGQSKDLPEYLERHAILNQMWPGLGYQFQGITKDPQTGSPQVVTSMNRIEGSKPEQTEIESWFREQGWQPGYTPDPNDEDQGIYIWKDPKTGTEIGDAHSDNFIKTAAGLVPIDINVIPGEGARKQISKEDEQSTIVGIKHPGSGEEYRFGQVGYGERGEITIAGTPKYNEKIYGEVKTLAETAAKASLNEHATSLPPGRFMAQPAFPVVGISEEERAKGVTWNRKEGRVHITTRDGKAEIVPHATWMKGEPLPVVFESDDTRAMAKAALDAINALPESERKGQIYAPDVVPTTEGFKVVEANPADETGASGYLQDNPFIMDAYVSQVTGREPAHVHFIRQLLTRRKKEEKSLRKGRHFKSLPQVGKSPFARRRGL